MIFLFYIFLPNILASTSNLLRPQTSAPLEDDPFHCQSSKSVNKPHNFTIIHFNDVYSIEDPSKNMPGGASRFKTALNSFKHINPLILFSGDAFSPSILTSTTHGQHMVSVMNQFDIKAAVFGNHEFDIKTEYLERWVAASNFPWLLSNLKFKNQSQIANSVDHVILTHENIKLGLIGLVGDSWIDQMKHISIDQISYEDYVEAANRLVPFLRAEGCELVIALTHMTIREDERLAGEYSDIDLILGGHEHINWSKKVKGTYIIKSGTDFKEFNLIKFEEPECTSVNGFLKLYKNRYNLNIERVEVSPSTPKDHEIDEIIDTYFKELRNNMVKTLFITDVPLELRSHITKVSEANLPNFLTDVLLDSTKAEIAIIHCGTFRFDGVIPSGPVTIGTLMQILPFLDLILVVEAKGKVIIENLEYGLMYLPHPKGSYLAVSGIEFEYDSKNEVGNRVLRDSVKIGGELIELDRSYKVATLEYFAKGKGGNPPLVEPDRNFDVDVDLLSAIMEYFNEKTFPKKYAKELREYNGEEYVVIAPLKDGRAKDVGRLSHENDFSL